MRSNKTIQPSWYALTDYGMAALAWIGFYFSRKNLLQQPLAANETFWLGVLLIPVAWLILFALVGSYNSVYKKSRLTEFTKTFVCTVLGCVVLFFLFLLD